MTTYQKLTTPLTSSYGRRWVLFDFVAGFICMLLALELTPYEDVAYETNRTALAFAYGIILAGCLRLAGLNTHRMEHILSYYEIVMFSFIGTLMAFIIVALVVNFTHFHIFGRYVIIAVLISTFLVISIQRIILKKVVGTTALKIVLLGTDDQLKLLTERVENSKRFVLAEDSFSKVDIEKVEETEDEQSARLLADQYCQNLKNAGVDLVITCYSEEIPTAVAHVAERLPFHGLDVVNKEYFLESYYKEITVDFQNLHWLMSQSFTPLTSAHIFLKRGLDTMVALIIGLMILPLIPIVGLLIKLDSRGPIFYSQYRVGLMGKKFRIYKFRTMKQNAEADGAKWATTNDPRVTNLGKFLRISRIDELPQIWNVINGDMSLIGPRPERPEFVETLMKAVPLYEWRHLIRPGLTGWAQIRYKYGASVEDAKKKLQYDLYYIKRASILLDIQIFFQTIPLIMKGSR